MYRLLIVDNEEFVVNGLVDLFNPEQHPTIEAVGAYSAAEALNLLMTTAMDIVITDIRMPGMTGLELQRIIAARWPYCKVIILSGYNDFAYAQEAIRQGSINYILKTEDDEVIINAIYEAIRAVQEEKKAKHAIEAAHQQLKQAMGAMQREFFESLLIGDKFAYRTIEQQLKQLEVPLAATKPIYVVICKVDEWAETYSHYDRSLLLYAVQNVANEYLTLSTIHYSFIYDRSTIIWLIQSKAQPWMENAQLASAIAITSHFIYGTFECIQSSCSELLHLSLSFSISSQPVDWKLFGKQYDTLKTKLVTSIKKQQLYLETEIPASEQKAEMKSVTYYDIYKQLDHLNYCLRQRNQDEFYRVFEELLHTACQSGQRITIIQITSSIYMSIYATISQFKIDSIPLWIIELQQSIEDGDTTNWQHLQEQLTQLAYYAFEQCLPAAENEENRVVQSIHAYLTSHLGGDLSLKTMAYAIGHNPSYLSRLYKQKAGKGLSETINEMKLERAKSLLEQSDKKISDISRAVGFLSEHYFYRFFKKATQMTPQEYREHLEVKKR